ncbi:MAG: inner membrane ABC transporter permease YddQ [Chloroflexi bacterium OLB15]|nr:MAG: inner membrane ABC transporter permease YddQ [Chloroflexi bacterium OLB15]
MSSTSSTISSIRVSGSRERIAGLGNILRRNPLLLIGLIVVIAWVLGALAAPLLAPFQPLQQNVAERLQPPGSPNHLWGTDELGRDIYSRVLYGGRITIPASLLVIVFGSVIGSVVGAVAGYLGGFYDELLMRLTELFMAFPTIILAMAVSSALGPSIQNAILALVVVWWPSYARMMRGLVIKAKTNDYVEAAQCLGASRFYLLWKTIVPNCLSPMLVMTTLDVGNAVLTFAGLSFLGLGPEPASPEWGRMVAVGIDYFDQWWMWLYPGAAIAFLVIAFNFIGDGLRDILDPRMR